MNAQAAPAAEPVVRAEGVRKSFGENVVLDGIDLSVAAGETLVVIGPSGSGKSTLLRCVNLLEPIDSGRIWLEGEEITGKGVKVSQIRQRIGIVFQQFNLFPHLKAIDNVTLAARRVRHMSRRDAEQRALELLTRVGLEEKAQQHPHQLSGGQQQRVALARALVYEPPVILLDEPLSNLDAKLREEARAWLRQLIVALDLSALCVTHDQVEAMAIADKIVLLNGGEIEQEGTPAELYEKPRTLFAAEFMGSNNRLTGISAGAGKLKIGGEIIEGAAHGKIEPNAPTTGVIRLERMRVAESPGPNRLKMELKTQMYLGERFELVFAREKLLVRAYAEKKLTEGAHYVEFPRDALWIFAGER